MPDEVRRPCWGKSSPDGSQHPLVDHCLDVAVVFRQFLDIPTMGRVETLLPGQKDRLSVLAFLHDLGKCNWGFQAKADPGAPETAGHVLEAMTLLCDLQPDWPVEWRALVEEMSSWFLQGDEGALQMLLAAISHHGRPASLNDYYARGGPNLKRFWRPRGGADPLRELATLACSIPQFFPDVGETGVPPIDAHPGLQQRFAGLVMLADWVGSDTQFFSYRSSPSQDRLEFAKKKAQDAARDIGLKPPESRLFRDFKDTFGFAPSPLQTALAMGLPVEDSTRLLLVESSTGSGKTEAALAWFLRLYAAEKVDGLYFALPTRVAARELYKRVLNVMDAAFDETARPRPVLLAAPGYVQADGLPVLPEAEGVLWDDSSRDRRQERLWSAARPKRFLAAPIAVGTVDQALLSVLRVKHSLMRSVCLDRHLLVVDEVHASDPYMRAVLQRLLAAHCARGGSALLLSATLGESAAAAFFAREERPLAEALCRPYPSITTRTREQPVRLSSTTSRVVSVAARENLLDDVSLLAPITTALKQGARVLVVCNTVARANALLRTMEGHLASTAPELLGAIFAANGHRCPHHGRFAREDRERLDALVSVRLGKGSPPGPLLLVGTQTLEQSLDIDADWLVTDLAPMDVLLQRLGRLHRHQRAHRPPAYVKPCALVRVPDQPLERFLRPGGSFRGPAGLGTVYPDGRILNRTLKVLSSQLSVSLPDDNRRLVESTTHPEALAALPPEWKAHGAYMEGEFLADVRSADAAVLGGQPFGELHYSGPEERVLTRLGKPTYDIPLVPPCPSPFGQSVGRVVIPAFWLGDGDPPPDAVRGTPTGDGFRVEVHGRSFRYTRFGLERDDVRPTE